MKKYDLHSFHIPVMGIGFTADSALRIAKYGIDSVISLVDDQLLEKIGNHYSKLYNKEYEVISEKNPLKRSIRITKYLNLVNEIVTEQFDQLINTSQQVNSEFKRLLSLLPENSDFRNDYQDLVNAEASELEIQQWIRDAIQPGAIDVNIMTKLDKDNYDVSTKEKLPIEYNDAHAAFKGFADSTLESSIILSAGLNNKLYSYMENFSDFFPDAHGKIKKRIILKVSDFRSAKIQSKFLAKKGLWVSEYRIESGLNCGGHAFATEGVLAGVVLEEFKAQRDELLNDTRKLIAKTFAKKQLNVDVEKLNFKVGYQSGVGTEDEHRLLLDYYKMDKVGWGSPFLLVPEVASIDEDTLNLVANAKEDDFYLSEASPLGVLFNNIKGNSRDILRDELVEKNRPGSACPKKYLALDSEFGERTLCASSKVYIKQKLSQLDAALENQELSQSDYDQQKNTILQRSCICVGLGVSALKDLDIKRTYEGEEISICPGPNAAYFTRKYELEEMVGNIYGRTTLVNRDTRPNLFIKEFKCYLDYLDKQILPICKEGDLKDEKRVAKFKENLDVGVNYYRSLISNIKDDFPKVAAEIARDLDSLSQKIGFKAA